MPAATLLTASSSNTDATSYTTASISPTANRWIVVDNWSRDDAGAPIAGPTITGLSLTWIIELTRVQSSTHQCTRAYAWTGASPGSGTILLDWGAATMDGGAWIVYELSSDVDTSDPFVQTVGNSTNGVVTSLSVTLAAFASVDNRPLICCSHRANEASDPEPGYTEIGDVTTSAPIEGFAAAYHPSATDTTVTYAWATACGPDVAIASEIKAAVASGAGVLDPMGMSGFFGA